MSEFSKTTKNIKECSCKTKPTNVAKEQKIEDNEKAVEVICKSFANYESIKATKEYNLRKKYHSWKHPPSKGFCLWCRKSLKKYW